MSGEDSKSGLGIKALASVVKVALNLPSIDLRGFMTMAPFDASHDELLAIFGALRDCRDAIERDQDISLPDLSMDMTGDYREAAECGATYVRIGTAIFGARQY